ncbi:hypothetical protein BGX29_007056 [Mortierella sp. GBA35]|nr:hypothetical protein BGX29_007056 [Mortierella sp. GBA35]
MSPGTVAKYAQHIKYIRNVKAREQLHIFKKSNLVNVKGFHMEGLGQWDAADRQVFDQFLHQQRRKRIVMRSETLFLANPYQYLLLDAEHLKALNLMPDTATDAEQQPRRLDAFVMYTGIRKALAQHCPQLTCLDVKGSAPKLTNELLTTAFAGIEHLQLT